MTELGSRVVEAWRRAADDLGLHFTAPFTTSRRGDRIEGMGFIHHFGRRLGTIISVLGEPSSLAHLVGKGQDVDYYISMLGPGYTDYRRESFIDTLDDRQFYGPDSARPVWYSGKHWGEELNGINPT
jgi:hypothetical protein